MTEHGAGLAEMCTWLLVTTRAEPAVIAVAIEMPHGPIVEMLLERGFLVNPKQLDRRRRLGRKHVGVLCRGSLPRRPEWFAGDLR
jgi:hypothetical protein